MIAGQMVSVQNPTTKRWDKRGIIVKARDPRNRTFQVKVDGTIWTCSKIFLHPVHIPLTDPSRALTGPQRSVCDQAYCSPLTPPLPAPPRSSAGVQERKEREVASTVNAILSTPTPTQTPMRGEEKKKPPLPEGSKNEEEREGQQQPPTCSSGQHRLCSLGATKLLSGQVHAAAAHMGLTKMLTGQFVFFQHFDNNHTFFDEARKKQHAHHRPIPHRGRHCNHRGNWRNNRDSCVPHSWRRRRRHRGPDQDRGGGCTSSSWATWSHEP
jgi:hypothetical protein